MLARAPDLRAGATTTGTRMGVGSCAMGDRRLRAWNLGCSIGVAIAAAVCCGLGEWRPGEDFARVLVPAAAAEARDSVSATAVPAHHSNASHAAVDSAGSGQPTLEILDEARKLAGPSRRLGTPRRGDLSSRFAFPIKRTEHYIQFSIPPLDLPPDAVVRMELRTADGKTLFTSEHKQREFYPRKTVLLRAIGGPLKPGKFVLRLAEQPARKAAARPPETAEFAFELTPAGR